MLIHFLAQLHSACGPLVTDATDGSSQVMARTAAQMAMQVSILLRGLAGCGGQCCGAIIKPTALHDMLITQSMST